MGLSEFDKRKIAIKLMGYGKPESNLWLMGFEESEKGKWSSNTSDEDFMKFKNGYTENINSEVLRVTPGTYRGYYRLISKIFPTHILNNNFFIANLLPFGKKDSSTLLSPEQCKIFGFKNHKELYEDTINERYNAIVDFFNKYKWKDKYIIFCIGNSNHKQNYLYDFLCILYKVKNNELLENIFKQDEQANNSKPKTYLLHDFELKKFITYQASSRYHIDRAIERIYNVKKYVTN